MSDDDKLRFQPRARIIRTIGDQLISGAEAAVIELVKNSYDADAKSVRIEFHPPLEVGSGRISITDDGHGMSLDDIRLKWMEPATSSKTKSRLSKLKHRRMMGSKGIGRFAAAKLGSAMSLVSTVQTESDLESVLIPELQWSIFSEDTYLSDIAIDYIKQTGEGSTGTTIEINGLSENWTAERLTRLHVELRRLISPLETSEDDDFSIYLDLSACTVDNAGFDGSALFAKASSRTEEDGSVDAPELVVDYKVTPFPLLTACDYELKGTFDASGSFLGTFQVRRGGRGPEQVALNVSFDEGEESPGPFSVHLFVFDREADAIKNNMKNAGMGELSAKDARQLLDNISGVAIYREGFRVRPYGNPENDWLALDTRRVQDPSLRIGHNQVAGYVTIEAQDYSNLVERSSREGFEENGAFARLTRLVTTLLTAAVEPKRYKFRSDTGLSRKRSTTFDEVRELSELKKIRTLIAKLDPAEQDAATKLIDQQSMRLRDRIDDLQERQRVLEAKSSLGMIIGEIIHDGGPRAVYVLKTAERMAKGFPVIFNGGKLGATAKDEIEKKSIPGLRRAGGDLNRLFESLEPLSGGKRGHPKAFFPKAIIRRTADIFESSGIPVSIVQDDEGITLIGYADDLSTALLNLIGNAVHWLQDSKTPAPAINVRIWQTDDVCHITVEDNGPGVPEEFVEDIFDVGFSLKEGGTGLGLNIAREALGRSGGTLLFHLSSTSGAAFEIIFPARNEQ
ncbi:sensor histidine kinase [Rhizobium leguminosarum]|uniref:ATP-binding protein n=1 Tax=Rhizobium TaxID=379 RepID=UPI00103F09D8|nr:sensor histidine kinase [Rhizobium leguminosarum]TCA65151.1 sensor histidine kinase [Rhizobium leguminosarum bv. viciae]